MRSAAWRRPDGWRLAWALAMGLIGPLVKQLTAEDDADRIVFITNLVLVPDIPLSRPSWSGRWPPLNVWPQLVLAGCSRCWAT